VVTNAGVSPLPDRILTDDMTEIRKTFETNFFGALAVARAFAPVVRRQWRRRIPARALRAQLDRRRPRGSSRWPRRLQRIEIGDVVG
jgi:NAD(P)-dependent dehydrogenase (short-subunit alcohol dehydrogenase family)